MPNGESPATKADIQRLENLIAESRADTEKLIGETRADFRHLEELTTRLIGSLSSEVETLHGKVNALSGEFHEFRDETRTNFERLDGTLKRHSTMITSGTLAVGGITKAISRLEDRERKRDAELRDVKARLRKLEQRRKSA
jgi:chromosome segregation ATPase